VPANQDLFRHAEGFELMVRFLREKLFAKHCAVKALDFAVARSVDNCVAFVTADGLKALFPAFMGKVWCGCVALLGYVWLGLLISPVLSAALLAFYVLDTRAIVVLALRRMLLLLCALRAWNRRRSASALTQLQWRRSTSSRLPAGCVDCYPLTRFISTCAVNVLSSPLHAVRISLSFVSCLL
jgi:hypothetical protein